MIKQLYETAVISARLRVIVVINETVVEVPVLEMATLVVLHVVPLDREAFLVVVVLPYRDQSPVVEVVSCPAEEAWVDRRMVEVHEKVVYLPCQEMVVEGPVEGDQEISLEVQVVHRVV